MKSLSTLTLLQPRFDTDYRLPFYTASVKAGFPSPAEDYIDSPLDLNAYLIAHPVATFYVRVASNTMQDTGIYENDLLIVDKSLKPSQGKLVLVTLHGRFLIKRYFKTAEGFKLVADNPKTPPIYVNREEEHLIWGVVTAIIHRV